MDFLVQFIRIAILQGAFAQLLLGGMHHCGHFSGAFQMTYFFRRVWAAPGGIALRGGCPGAEFFVVRIFLYSEWMRGFAPWVSVSGPCAGWGAGGCGRGGLCWAFFTVSLGRYFRSEQLFLHNFVYSARSGFNPTRSLSIFSENIKILSENIKKLVVIWCFQEI